MKNLSGFNFFFISGANYNMFLLL